MSPKPTQPTTEAAPNRAASFMPGDIVTVNNPGSSLHGRVGRVRHSGTRFARIDFTDMFSHPIAHEHLTKGERE